MPIIRVAHVSRVLAMASRHRGLFFSNQKQKRLFRRDAETNTRDACATQSLSPRVKDSDCRTVREQRPAFRANADTVAVVNAYRSGF